LILSSGVSMFSVSGSQWLLLDRILMVCSSFWLSCQPLRLLCPPQHP
jgi:hypothetical protein